MSEHPKLEGVGFLSCGCALVKSIRECCALTGESGSQASD